MTPLAAKYIIDRHRPDLERLRQRIVREWLQTGTDPNVKPLLQWQFDCDAKYFRPLTVFSCFRAVSNEEVPDRLIVSAQVVEMVHNVTLIIDDIVDKSTQRRGKDTLWVYAGNDELTAYMVAGYILADGYDIIARQLLDEREEPRGGLEIELPRPRRRRRGAAPDARKSDLDRTGLIGKRVCDELNRLGPVRYDLRLLSELVKRLAIAECVQWKNRKQPLRLADWHYLAREDTGSMFEICAALGARSHRLRRFGRLLGMLYHGCDDVADLREARDLGGTGDEDLQEGILTLPAALAIEADSRIEALFCKPQRSRADFETLHGAFVDKLEAAEAELDRLLTLAVDEAEAAQSCAPDYLVALAMHTRRLSGRPGPD
jgi:geranylgeranyl pyrophosphate synthase